MSNLLKRGSLVVFEGCDRSGKTTQINKLVTRLNKDGIPSKMMRFPERSTGIGVLINQYLTCNQEMDDHVIHLLFSANRWEMVDEIKRSLESGVTVLVDRYAFSGVAFSAAKAGVDLSWCKGPDVGLPRPDLVCYLHVSEEEAKKRADFGGERYERTEFQAKVREVYDKLADSSWKTINADKSMEEVEENLYAILSEEVIRPKGKLGLLWITEDHS